MIRDQADSTSRRKTSLSLSTESSKALARAKFELFSQFDLQVSQGEILDAVLVSGTKDLDRLRRLIESRRHEGRE